MLNKLSLKVKITFLGILIALAFAVLGITSISELGRYYESTRDNFVKVRDNVEVLNDVNNAHVIFKIQVQEWKNVLIRGNDAKQYEKYSTRFAKNSDRVQELLGSAVEKAKSLGIDAGPIEDVKKEHAALKTAYLTALKTFDASDELTGKKVDKQVSGVDRPASKGMTAIALDTEQRFKDLITNTFNSMEEDYTSIRNSAVTIMVVCSLIVLIIMIVIFRDLLKLMGGEPAYASQVLDSVADGQLDINIALAQGDTRSLLARINSMKERLSEVIQEVRSSADALASASEEVSSTAQSLAKGASVQAASVEETSSSMEQMSASITQNNENASITDGMAQKAAKEATVGGEAVGETVVSMQKIAEKIGVIDDIAYQTNLLALNAAIEAGRAGDHGKGFAVVATEVRKLAERSSVAAREIGELAKASVTRAEAAGKSLEEIVPSISKTADLVQEIAAASSEQASGVHQINSAIGQVSQTMQQNAAASEELSSTSEEMSAQALKLQETVDYFKLDGHKKRSRRTEAPARVSPEPPTLEVKESTDNAEAGSRDDDDSKFERYD